VTLVVIVIAAAFPVPPSSRRRGLPPGGGATAAGPHPPDDAVLLVVAVAVLVVAVVVHEGARPCASANRDVGWRRRTERAMHATTPPPPFITTLDMVCMIKYGIVQLVRAIVKYLGWHGSRSL
jgi:hypothetical protein